MKYFKLAVAAAQDPKFAKQKKDALFNVARVYHAAKRWDDAAPAYKEYLAAYPNDPQATAGLASVYFAQGKRDEAMAMYAQLLQHAEAAEASDLFRAGQQILSALTPPDTAVQGNQCRADDAELEQVPSRCARSPCAATRPPGRRCARSKRGSAGEYRMVEQVYEAGLTKVPYDREALFTLSGVAVLAGRHGEGAGGGAAPVRGRSAQPRDVADGGTSVAARGKARLDAALPPAR